MSYDKWMEELDNVCDAIDQQRIDKTPRDLNDLEKRRFDYLAKLAQQQASEVDLLIAESYAARGKPHGELVVADLADSEKNAITTAKNGLEVTNARLRAMRARYRFDCNMPYHATLRGFEWYDESSGRPVKIVQDKKKGKGDK